MNKVSRILSLAIFSSFMISGCTHVDNSSVSSNPSASDTQEVGDTRIKDIYSLYRANGGEMTYEEWLQSIKGKDGRDGKDGCSLLTGHGVPSESEGKTGDSYINLDTWDFFVKATNGWAKEGNLKIPVNETYTVKWLDFDGTVLEIDENVTKGSMPAFGGVTPTRKQDKYKYTFTGWSPSLKPVTGNQEYVAQYDSHEETYTITWKNYDGSVLSVDSDVQYGTIPTYDKQYPTRAKDDAYSYEFSGWNPSVTAVIGNQTYVATFFKTNNRYLVKFVDEDGALLQSSYVDYGSTPSFNQYYSPKKESTAQYDYVFKGWDKELSPVTEDVTFTAVYSKKLRSYTIKWLANGYTIKSEQVDYGQIPNQPSLAEVPDKSPSNEYTYQFKGWDREIEAVTGNTTYTAVYERKTRQYLVSWMDENGNLLKKEQCDYLSSVGSYTPDLTDNQIFMGWKTNQSRNDYLAFPYTITKDVSFYATIVNKFEFTYLPLTDSYSLTKSAGTKDMTTFPATYDDGVHGLKNVTEIGTSAFEGTSITSMIIPDTVTYIHGETFKNCDSLATLFIPSSVTNIQEGAIYGDLNLSVYCEAERKPETWDDYWNVVHYVSGKTNHFSNDTFNKNIEWGYSRG